MTGVFQQLQRRLQSEFLFKGERAGDRAQMPVACAPRKPLQIRSFFAQPGGDSLRRQPGEFAQRPNPPCVQNRG
jgi:hypothetical protein